MINPIELTRELLRFNTINPPGMERACARRLGKLLEDAEFKCTYHEFAEGRTTLVAEIGGGQTKPPICFTGHIDTVPLGAAPWSRDAFAGETDGDKMFGRGASDMKSGIAAFVIAALRLAPHLRATPGLLLVLTASEEVGCEGAKYLADNRLLDRAGAIVVAEPSANYPFVGHKGLCWFEVETRGKNSARLHARRGRERHSENDALHSRAGAFQIRCRIARRDGQAHAEYLHAARRA